MSRAHPSGRSWLASPPPHVAVEITATRVTAVAIADQRDSRVVTAHATQPLAPGLAVPSLNAVNVTDERALAGVVGDVLAALGYRPRRIALVLPDSIAKISLIRFEKVPARAQDLDELIRWQVRKTAPFRIEDAQVSWQAGAAVAGGGREYLVSIARRDIVQGYERACDAAGVHAGVVDIASFNQINAVLAGQPLTGDWLLVNLAADYATLAVVRAGEVIFFRNRSAAGESELAELVHQTAMYHEDRLGGGGFTRVVLAGSSVLGRDQLEWFRRGLTERIGGTVEPIDFRPAAALSDRIAAGPELLDILAAPVGILVRERVPSRPEAHIAAGGVA